MRLPKLSPLQSRFAASLAASVSLVILYLVLSSPRFAYAADVDSLTSDHPVATLESLLEQLNNGIELDGPEAGQEKAKEQDDDRGNELRRRVPAGMVTLANNAPKLSNIEAGQTQHWAFPQSEVNGEKSATTPGLPSVKQRDGDPEEEVSSELKRRDLFRRSTTVYVSATTCLQPSTNMTGDAVSNGPPQLQLYISSELTNPGPDGDSSKQQFVEADGGYMAMTLDAEDDVYIGVMAPNSTAWTGVYNYELTASIDAPYHSIDADDPNLFFVDGDNHAALLVTNNLTDSAPGTEVYDEWMGMKPPFTMFVHNTNDSAAIVGMENSYCGLQKMAQIRSGSSSVKTGMINRGIDKKPKEEFYITNLNSSSTYFGFLAMTGNSTSSGGGVVGGGGKIWQAMNFTTKAMDNCAVLNNLTFCSEVAYAVPSNPDLSVDKLRELYDSNAAALFQNFTYSMQQVQCEASSENAYSLVTTCDDCAQAYKQWLCAVTIPRCYDFSADLSYLRPRNTGQSFLNGTSIPETDPLRQSVLTNSSRNALIDEQIKPGPYKEVLPCQELCWELVQTCPSIMGFGCPDGPWLNDSYGARSSDGDITCSYPGAAYFLNGAWRAAAASRVALGALAGFWFFAFVVF